MQTAYQVVLTILPKTLLMKADLEVGIESHHVITTRNGPKCQASVPLRYELGRTGTRHGGRRGIPVRDKHRKLRVLPTSQARRRVLPVA